VLTDFRGVNQRMHDKTLVVDGKVAITDGRNMAAEYFDYNQEYNFRDRDALLLGEAVKAMQASFESFWNSELAVKVAELYDGLGLGEPEYRVGVIMHDEALARAGEASIETDMAPGNSWAAAKDDPDQYVSLAKRGRVRLYQLMPIKPLL